MRAVLVLFCCFLFLIPAFAGAKAYVVYNKPVDTDEAAIKVQLENSDVVNSVASLINDNFKLPEQLSFVFGGDEGPLYDSHENKIIIPYLFLVEVKERLKHANYEETGVSEEQAIMDVLMHTMFHEFAHALIHLYELPVLGKEEDAADGLADFLLIEFFEDGQEITITAADLFDMESLDRDVLEDEDFWDEHSLDEQRYYSTLCHVYGSDPEKYAFLLEKDVLPEERTSLCIDDYEKLANSWLEILAPYLKAEQQEADE